MSGTDAFVNPTATPTAFTSSMSSSNNSMSPTIMSASTSMSMSMSMSVGRSSSLFRRSSTTINTKHQKQASLTKNILQTLRRRFTILLASTLLLFGPSLLPKHPTLNPGIPPAHASTTTTSPTPLTPRAKKTPRNPHPPLHHHPHVLRRQIRPHGIRLPRNNLRLHYLHLPQPPVPHRILRARVEPRAVPSCQPVLVKDGFDAQRYEGADRGG